LHTLGIFFLNQNHSKIARLYLSEVVSKDPNRHSSWLHLAYSDFLISDYLKLEENLSQFNKIHSKSQSSTDIQLLNFLNKKLKEFT